MPPTWLDAWRARVMFTLSVVFLLLLAGLLHRHQTTQDFVEDDGAALHVGWHETELLIQLAGLAVLWPVFLLEAAYRFWRRDSAVRARDAVASCLFVVGFPPLRLGAHRLDPQQLLWLPSLGWRVVDRELRRDLERLFSVPMILIALLVVPLLAIQYGWPTAVAHYPALELFLEVGNAVVWFAFAFEFLVMVSVAERKLSYCFGHWVDLAIIILPFVQFLPLARVLRLGRLLRLEQLTRMGRLYRMQGLSLRAYRAFLLLDVIRRLTGRSLENRLRRLDEMLVAKEAEVDELKQEIAELKTKIALKSESEPAAPPPPPG